ncbi:MAG: flagellar biosynthesis protein FliQ [Abditibacteriales bacterium]|nr:flagellar biosynthesis protein FliQ [Abditibacteriales bacterium]MDW8366760.1 flagellar biosynthesis protein FliQ [Abditibacteriales bacterium]
MTDLTVIELAHQALWMTLLLSLPILGFGLIAGVVVSVFQAVTQIQEMTLSFVPKVLSVVLAFVLLGSWMLNQLVSFTTQLLSGIPDLVK